LGQFLLIAVFSASNLSGHFTANPVMQRVDSLKQCQDAGKVAFALFKKSLPTGARLMGASYQIQCEDLANDKMVFEDSGS
jgi:hypothetical protein